MQPLNRVKITYLQTEISAFTIQLLAEVVGSMSIGDPKIATRVGIYLKSW